MSSTAPCPIYDAERIAVRMLAPPSDIREYLLTFFPNEQIPELSEADPTAAPLVAVVNHGVWIAPCPCRSPGEPAPGLVVWLSLPWGWCLRCRNRETGGLWRPVTVPLACDVAAIEAALSVRPSVANCNWEPGETVADLLAQNDDHQGEGV